MGGVHGGMRGVRALYGCTVLVVYADLLIRCVWEMYALEHTVYA